MIQQPATDRKRISPQPSAPLNLRYNISNSKHLALKPHAAGSFVSHWATLKPAIFVQESQTGVQTLSHTRQSKESLASPAI